MFKTICKTQWFYSWELKLSMSAVIKCNRFKEVRRRKTVLLTQSVLRRSLTHRSSIFLPISAPYVCAPVCAIFETRPNFTRLTQTSHRYPSPHSSLPSLHISSFPFWPTFPVTPSALQPQTWSVIHKCPLTAFCPHKNWPRSAPATEKFHNYICYQRGAPYKKYWCTPPPHPHTHAHTPMVKQAQLDVEMILIASLQLSQADEERLRGGEMVRTEQPRSRSQG